MEEYRNTDFTKIRKILWKNNSTSILALVLLCILTAFTLIVFVGIRKPDSHEVRDFTFIKAFFTVWRSLFLVLPRYSHFNRKNKEKILLNHINKWTIIVKRPKISEFRYYRYKDVDEHIRSWYIVVARDSWVEYKSLEDSKAFFTWESWISINKNYYSQRWIPYSLNDPMYLDSMEYVKTKQLEQQVKTLKDQIVYVDGKEKKKLKKEIAWLEKEIDLLLPQHLISHWPYLMWSKSIITHCYIWDEINVFVDPNDPKNYIMEV